jgi:hypothetical protein
MCFDNATAVPVLHYVFSLSVGYVHVLGSAEQSPYVLKRSQADIFTPNEWILQ